MHNNTFIFLLLIQGFTFCADKINLLEGYSIEEIALLFEYAQVEKCEKSFQYSNMPSDDEYIKTKFEIPELKDVHPSYKIRNIIKNALFPGFYFLNTYILKRSENMKDIYSSRIKKNGEKVVLHINNEVHLYAIDNKNEYFEYYNNRSLFLKNIKNNTIMPLKINNSYTDSIPHYLSSSTYKDFQLNQNILTFTDEYSTYLTLYNFYEVIRSVFFGAYFETNYSTESKFFKIGLPIDQKISALKNKYEIEQFRNTMQVITFLVSLLVLYKIDKHLLCCLFFSPLLLFKVITSRQSRELGSCEQSQRLPIKLFLN